ncbi:hypothetical protein CBS101457_001746 [Exobasidium rhododendri]|nr:hypothetical protein CBS101457_001746 [Exobasidium rhododendri]
MDLNVLFAAQIEQLRQCYAELGHAPERLQSALQNAIDSEVERSTKDITEAKEEIDALKMRCERYHSLLDEPASISTATEQSTTLLVHIKELQAELGRLQSIYASRKAQVDKLVVRIEEYRPILGDQVPIIDLDTPPNSTTVLALPRPSELHAILSSCGDEVRKRSLELEKTLKRILQQWSDMWIMPQVESPFEAMVLHHFNVRPLRVELDEGRIEFAGVFVEGEQGSDEHLEATPSRKSGSERELNTHIGSVQLRNAMAPTLENLAIASDRIAELDAEKERRFEKIQTLYDELSSLWKRFDVADEAVDEFVQENTGCTFSVIQAYERELKQMKELKAEHMTMFVSKVREDIATLWDQLLMTEDERRDNFPEFFDDLGDGDESGVEPSDELLSLHEEKVKELSDEVKIKAKPLELIRQYNKLLEESQELEASAKDTSRLMGRGNNGQKRDPGRLLREEKMRKRIKVLKPKFEEELLRTIPIWEGETNRAFCVNGVRFLDTIDVEPRSPRKRVRTVSSTAPTAATPQHEGKRSRVESTHKTANPAQRVAATPQSKSQHGLPTPSTKTSGIPRQPGFTPASAARQPMKAISNQVKSSNEVHRITSTSSNGSTSSQATDRTVIEHKPSKLKKRGPSLSVEESLRNLNHHHKSDFAKPSSTGAGATVRPVTLLHTKNKNHAQAANDSGPNWAVLLEEDDESNLLS